MKTIIENKVNNLIATFSNLSKREKNIVYIVITLLILFFIRLVYQNLSSQYEHIKLLSLQREQDYQELKTLIRKYKITTKRYNEIQKTLELSNVSLTKTTEELDSIIKATMGNTEYNFSKTRTPVQLGNQAERQDFSLVLNGLSLEQITKLLFNLENSKVPIFISKVEAYRDQQNGTINLTLNIFGIRKNNSQSLPPASS